jgi:hypothetical protein
MSLHRMTAFQEANLGGRAACPRQAAGSDRAMTRRSRKGGNSRGKDATCAWHHAAVRSNDHPSGPRLGWWCRVNRNTVEVPTAMPPLEAD